MVAGISNSQARFVVNQTAERASTFEEIATTIEYPLRYRAIGLLTRNPSTQGLKQNHASIIAAAADASKRLSAYSETLESLLLYLEYNPGVDTADYAPDLSETQERMDRLKNDLAETLAC
jgi:hypothetical protein